MLLPARVQPPSSGSVTRGNMAVFDDTSGALLRETSYNENDIRLKPLLQVSEPTDGATVTINFGLTHDVFQILEPAAALASLTITLGTPQDKQIVWITSLEAITALTLQGSGGAQVSGAATSLTAGQTVGYMAEDGDLGVIWWRLS